VALTGSGVPGLILGTAQLVTDYGVTRGDAPVRSDVEAQQFLSQVWSAGVRVLDTAPAYGRAEEVIGTVSERFSIHTKIERGVVAPESLRSSLRRLNIDSVDVLYIHDIDEFRSRPSELDHELHECLGSGARRAGVSVYEPDEIDLALMSSSVGVVQLPLNVLDRRFVGSVQRLTESGVSCVVRSVFLQGTLLCEPDRLPQKVRHLDSFVREFRNRCNDLGVSPLVGSLAFVAQIENVAGVIVGAQTYGEFQGIVEAWVQAVDLPDVGRSLGEIAVPSGHGVDPRGWR